MEQRTLYEMIEDQCKEQIDFSERLEQYVKEILLVEINKLKNDNMQQQDIQTKNLDIALSLLISQGIRTYKANLILVKEGYSNNALAGLRSLVEIIFNIGYILENEKLVYKRASNYLNNKKNDKVWKKAELSLNRELYKHYKILCEYSHFNLVATQHNVKEGKIIVAPDDEMSEETMTFINSIYYYFIFIICEHYKLSFKCLSEIDIPTMVKKTFQCYKTEKDVVDVFMNIVSDAGINKEFVLEEYKKYKISEQENKKSSNKKNKKK